MQTDTLDTQTPEPAPEIALKNLGELLEKYNSISKNIAADGKYLESIKSDLSTFAINGDLRDEKALAAIATKQIRGQFLPIRLEAMEAALQTVKSEIEIANKSCEIIITRLFTKIQCGHAEIAAKVMLPYCDSLAIARKQALRSSKAADAARSERDFRVFCQQNEPAAIAERILKLENPLMAESKELEKKVGKIPSLAEMVSY